MNDRHIVLCFFYPTKLRLVTRFLRFYFYCKYFIKNIYLCTPYTNEVYKREKVKILGRGEIKSKLEVKAHAFSATAKEAIEAKGGSTATI